MFLFCSILLFSFPAGFTAENVPVNKPGTDIKTNPALIISTRTFTLTELNQYDGKKSTSVYVAVNGIVYDVTNVKPWRTGKHMGLHTAGQDLTESFKQAPKHIHIERKVLAKLPQVGVLIQHVDTKKDKGSKKEVPEIYKLTKSEIGIVSICPITGEEFKVTATTSALKYKGKVYYFCCPGCDDTFRKNPEKYVK